MSGSFPILFQRYGSFRPLAPRGYCRFCLQTFWKIKDNQYRYMRWLGGVLGREEANPSQWYTVTKDDFVRNGGGPLLALFQESHHNLLSSLYPHIEWLPWMFHTAPHGFWGEMANQRQYMKWLGQLLRREEGSPTS